MTDHTDVDRAREFARSQIDDLFLDEAVGETWEMMNLDIELQPHAVMWAALVLTLQPLLAAIGPEARERTAKILAGGETGETLAQFKTLARTLGLRIR